MWFHTWHPESILVTVGSVTIHWYGLTLALGAIAGYATLLALGRRMNFSTEKLSDLFFRLIIFGLIGARLYHVTNEWAYYSAHPNQILQLWNGGLAIHGGIIVGAGLTWWFARRQRWNAWQLADVLVLALAIGQAIGRWGNYFNQELFGRPTSLPWGIPIDLLNRPSGYQQFSFFHPTFLYESLGLLIIFGAGWWLLTGRRQKYFIDHPGFVTAGYFFIAAVLRLGTEFLRIDQVPIVWGLRLPIITSILMMLTAVVIVLIRRHATHVRPA